MGQFVPTPLKTGQIGRKLREGLSRKTHFLKATIGGLRMATKVGGRRPSGCVSAYAYKLFRSRINSFVGRPLSYVVDLFSRGR